MSPMTSKLRRLWPVGLLASLVSILTACGDDTEHPLSTLEAKGPYAQDISNLSKPIFLVAGVIFVVVEVMVLFLIFRFRRRKTDQDGVDEPVQYHGNTRMELAWTIVPALILVVLGVLNVQTLWDLERAKENAETRVEVIGQQWWWEYRYDFDEDGKIDTITANQLVIPVGESIGLDIQSNDVIHSFWIPNLNGKQDAVPGRTTGLAIQADAPGIYAGQCTEFCGLSHGYMRMEVKALEAADFEIWKENQLKGPVSPAAGSLAAEGLELFGQRCAGCHQIDGIDSAGEPTGTDVPETDYLGAAHPLTAGNAPNLTHLMSREKFAGNMFDLYLDNADATAAIPEGDANEGNLARWLRDPEAMKPMAPDQGRGMPNLNLSEPEIERLVAYLITLQ